MQAAINFFLNHRDKIAIKADSLANKKAVYVQLDGDNAAVNIYAKTPEELVAVGEEIIKRARELMPVEATPRCVCCDLPTSHGVLICDDCVKANDEAEKESTDMVPL